MATSVAADGDQLSAPWTVIAYAPVQIVWMIVYRIMEGTGFTLQNLLFGALLEVALGIGMFKRSKAAWIIALILLILPILGVVNLVLDDGPAAAIRDIIGIVATVFILLHSRTRSWCLGTALKIT